MALNKTLICSQAAFHLGLPRFTDVENEETVEAITINEVYDWSVDQLLRVHTWNFATKRVELAQDVATPAFGYTYQYTLPADFLREVRLSDRQVRYKIEDGKLLTNTASIKMQYIYQVTNPGKFDPVFGECLALLIAYKTCLILTKDDGLRAQLKQLYDRELSNAKRIDALEGTPEFISVYGYNESKDGDGIYSTTSDVED